MTQVQIAIEDVLGRSPSRGDRLWVRAARTRSGSGGQVIAPVAVPVEVYDSPTIEMEPGPARVRFELRDLAVDQTREFPVTVPAEGTVTLREILDESYDWTPDQLSAFAQLRAEAVDAAERAEGWATSFGLSATASTLAPGSPATVTVTGDGPAYSVAFGVPQGDKGAKGDPGDVSAAQLASALAGKADLVGGQVPTSQIPAVALSKPSPVADRAAMLALSAQEGDVAVITAGADKGTYMLGSGPSTVFGSWVQLISPDGPVQSVNSQTGTVVLSAADVGARSSSWVPSWSEVSGKPAKFPPDSARLDAAPATWRWNGTALPTSAAQVHAQARVGDFIVAPNLTTDPGWHQITGV